MKEHCYSGLEGLCRSLAALATADPGHPVSEAVFGRDVFNGSARFDTNYGVSRTWRLVPVRRIGQFILAWTPPSEVAAVKKRLATYERGVYATYERRALAACVEALAGEGDGDGDDAPTSLRDALAALPSPVAALRDEVIPAVVDGFFTERYPLAAINSFQRDMDQLLDRIVRLDDFGLRKLLARLVAAVVFGPGHRLALSSDVLATESPDDDPLPVAPAEARRVALTQAFDARMAVVGASLSFDDGCAMFVGRSSDVCAYRERLDACAGCGRVAELVRALDAQVFRLADDNRAVSNVHGVVFNNGAAWAYCDLGSSNGSVICGPDGDLLADPLRVLAPGDRLVLGTGAPCFDATDYCSAATLVFSERYDG